MSVPAALWAHARPKLWPFLWLLALFGYGWAHWDRGMLMRGGPDFVVVLVAWTLLNAGTLWLNAALDRDEGEVLLGASAPIPPGIVGAAYVALVATVVVAAFATPIAAACAAACALLAIAYSHPRVAWKGHPLGGPAVNLIGYGWLTPLAGWSCAGVAMNARTGVVFGLAGVAILAVYFTAQAFQGPEDAARGYRTLVATHGPRVVLGAARACFLGLTVGALGLVAAGWVPRVDLVALPLVLWIDRYLARWAEVPGGGDAAWARGLTLRLFGAAMAVLAVNYADYVRADLAGAPVAGLGTVAGRPTDRPSLPPAAMRVWEAAHPGR